MDYEHDKVEAFWKGWWRAARLRPWRTIMYVILTLLFCGAVLFTGSYVAAKGAQLAKVEEKVDGIETRLTQIADAMETLVIAQRIDRIEKDNSILLDYDPIPQSIRITVGPLVNYPRPNYGYRLEGRKIYIVAKSTMERVQGRIATGGVTVEYLRKVDFDNVDEGKPNRTRHQSSTSAE